MPSRLVATVSSSLPACLEAKPTSAHVVGWIVSTSSHQAHIDTHFFRWTRVMRLQHFSLGCQRQSLLDDCCTQKFLLVKLAYVTSGPLSDSVIDRAFMWGGDNIVITAIQSCCHSCQRNRLPASEQAIILTGTMSQDSHRVAGNCSTMSTFQDIIVVRPASRWFGVVRYSDRNCPLLFGAWVALCNWKIFYVGIKTPHSTWWFNNLLEAKKATSRVGILASCVLDTCSKQHRLELIIFFCNNNRQTILYL